MEQEDPTATKENTSQEKGQERPAMTFVEDDVGEVNLSQAEADALMQMEKYSHPSGFS
jgi:hypothetical protein